MRPLTLRTKLTLFYSITVSVLLIGFAFVYYRVLSFGIDRGLNQELVGRTSGLHAYLRFDEGQPILVYDSNDPEEVTFINTATRYYQIYEIRTGKLLLGSEELRASAVEFSASDIAHYAQTAPSFVDLHTDQGKIRLRYEAIPGEG